VIAWPTLCVGGGMSMQGQGMQGQGPPPGYNQPTNNPPTNNPPMNGAMNGGMNQGHHGRGPPPMYGQAPPPYPAAGASQQHHGQGGPLGYAYLGGPSQQPPSAAPSGSAMHNHGYGGPPPQYAQQPQPVQAQQAAAPPKQDTPKAQIEKGSLCWYRDTDGSAKKVEVVSVDRSIIPPSYVIRIDGRDRETEVPFLSQARGGKGLGRAASGGALAPELPRDTRIQPKSRGARRQRALARRRRAPTGSDQSKGVGPESCGSSREGSDMSVLPSQDFHSRNRRDPEI